MKVENRTLNHPRNNSLIPSRAFRKLAQKFEELSGKGPGTKPWLKLDSIEKPEPLGRLIAYLSYLINKIFYNKGKYLSEEELNLAVMTIADGIITLLKNPTQIPADEILNILDNNIKVSITINDGLLQVMISEDDKLFFSPQSDCLLSFDLQTKAQVLDQNSEQKLDLRAPSNQSNSRTKKIIDNMGEIYYKCYNNYYENININNRQAIILKNLSAFSTEEQPVETISTTIDAAMAATHKNDIRNDLQPLSIKLVNTPRDFDEKISENSINNIKQEFNTAVLAINSTNPTVQNIKAVNAAARAYILQCLAKKKDAQTPQVALSEGAVVLLNAAYNRIAAYLNPPEIEVNESAKKQELIIVGDTDGCEIIPYLIALNGTNDYFTTIEALNNIVEVAIKVMLPLMNFEDSELRKFQEDESNELNDKLSAIENSINRINNPDTKLTAIFLGDLAYDRFTLNPARSLQFFNQRDEYQCLYGNHDGLLAAFTQGEFAPGVLEQTLTNSNMSSHLQYGLYSNKVGKKIQIPGSEDKNIASLNNDFSTDEIETLQQFEKQLMLAQYLPELGLFLTHNGLEVLSETHIDEKHTGCTAIATAFGIVYIEKGVKFDSLDHFFNTLTAAINKLPRPDTKNHDFTPHQSFGSNHFSSNQNFLYYSTYFRPGKVSSYTQYVQPGQDIAHSDTCQRLFKTVLTETAYQNLGQQRMPIIVHGHDGEPVQPVEFINKYDQFCQDIQSISGNNPIEPRDWPKLQLNRGIVKIKY